MRKIVYYVATSLDGYISGPNNDISGFMPDGNGVPQYLDDLKGFDTVLMGRKTYEFGYDYGLKPGQNPYSHMKTYIFSKTLKFENQDKAIEVCDLDLIKVKELKAEKGTPIYLCGGGLLAAWLLENQLIDEIKIKLNPPILGEGVRLFSKATKKVKLKLKQSKTYEFGLQIMSYFLEY